MNGLKTMRAVILQGDRRVKVEEIPIPIPRPTEILLKVVTIGQNPADWKHAELFSEPGFIMGCDFVGEVVSVGSEVPSGRLSATTPTEDHEFHYVELGQLRWGFIRGGSRSRSTGVQKGAFAQFVTIEWDLTGLLPNNISSEQGASIPAPFATAVQTLYTRFKLPEYPAKSSKNEWILVWSGATSVGQYVIQLAKLAGLRVATTASEKRWNLMRNLGADVTLDYKDPDVVRKLKEATSDEIQYGIDCISENGSVEIVQAAFRPSGGYLITLIPEFAPERVGVRKEMTLGYTVLGEDQFFTIAGLPELVYKTSEEDRATYVKWCRIGSELFKEGFIKPLEVQVLGGLYDVEKGFNLMKTGKHTSKIVFRICED